MDMDVHLGFDPTQLQVQLQDCGFAVRQACRMVVVEKPDKNDIDKAYPLFFLLVQKPHPQDRLCRRAPTLKEKPY